MTFWFDYTLVFDVKKNDLDSNNSDFYFFSSTNDLGNDDRSETISQESLPLSKSYFKGNSDYFNASKKDLIGKNLIQVLSYHKFLKLIDSKSIVFIFLNANSITNFQIYIFSRYKISCFN